jgi:Putative prokaryotic signal transducing protein
MDDPDFDPPASGDELVTVATFDNAVAARLAFNLLREAGLLAVLLDENTVAMDWLLSNAVGGIKIQVNSKDVTRARRLIDDHQRQGKAAEGESAPLADEMDEESLDALARAAVPDDFVSEQDEPDLEEPPPLSTREQLALYAIRGSLLGILFPPIEFYVLYLVFKVFVSDERLGARYRNLACVAALIMLIVLGGCYAIIRPR